MSPTYRFVLLAYPDDYRRDHGPELVATANELSPSGWSARQAVSLGVEGVRTRARTAAGPNGSNGWFLGAALGLALWHLLGATAHLTYLFGTRGDIVYSGQPVGLSAIASLAGLGALTVTTRWPTAVVLSVPLGAPLAFAEPGMPMEFWIQSLAMATAVTAIGWWLALRGPGRRALSPARAGVLLVAFTAVSWLFGSPGATIPAAAVLVGLPIAGLALAAFDPRPAIAAGTVWLVLATTAIALAVVSSSELTSIRSITFVGVCTALLMAGRYGTQRLTLT